MEAKKFAFLIHPRVSAREDMGKVFRPFRLVPEEWLRWGIKYFPPIPRGRVNYPNNNEIFGWMIVVPLTGYQILRLPRDFVVNKILQAIHTAEKLGVEITGLGELTSSITGGGEDLLGRVNCSITNGNALTAGFTFESVKRACATYRVRWGEERVAVIGATGSVGTGVSLLLAEEGIPLVLVARGRSRLEDLGEKIKVCFPQSRVEITQNLDNIQGARIVVVATGAVGQVVKAEHLAEGALVYDITQPRNTAPSILEQRKDVIIIDGGVVATPGINYGMDIGLQKGQAYACLVETMLLALAGYKNNYVGNTTAERAKEMLRLMEAYSTYFQWAPFSSFGKPIHEEQSIGTLSRVELSKARP